MICIETKGSRWSFVHPEGAHGVFVQEFRSFVNIQRVASLSSRRRYKVLIDTSQTRKILRIERQRSHIRINDFQRDEHNIIRGASVFWRPARMKAFVAIFGQTMQRHEMAPPQF
jgi:hypothetical protein